MIRINIADIGPDGLDLDGEEDSAFLELDAAGGMPVTVLGNVRYQFHAALAGHDLLVRGSAFTTIKTQCASCLKDLTVTIGSDKICIFIEKAPKEIIDITEQVREDILLSLPARFKCSENCKGLCPRCGADLNAGPCRCRKKPAKKRADHTWDALDKLKF